MEVPDRDDEYFDWIIHNDETYYPSRTVRRVMGFVLGVGVVAGSVLALALRKFLFPGD